MAARILIRADASVWIGTGHVMRCRTLANKLRSLGMEVIFICRQMPGDCCELLESNGYVVHRLEWTDRVFEYSDQEKRLQHLSWLGVPEGQEIEEVKTVLAKEGKVDWIIVDHYALDKKWEQTVRPFTNKIMVLDDIADRSHDSDLLLDQNLMENARDRYLDRISPDCKLLTGCDYALLQETYSKLSERIPSREGEIKRILVYFGGADQTNLTGLTLDAFLKINRSDIRMDIVISSSSPFEGEIKAKASKYNNIFVFQNLPSLALLISCADLAVGAGGASNWERCCLGLPSLIITLADNQIPIASELHKKGLVDLLGHFDQVDIDLVESKLRSYIKTGLEKSWADRCKEYVDGKGLDRVASIIMNRGDKDKFTSRFVVSNDSYFLKDLLAESLSNGNSEYNINDIVLQWLQQFDQYQVVIIENNYGLRVGAFVFKLVSNVSESGAKDRSWELNSYLLHFYDSKKYYKIFACLAISKLRQTCSGCLNIYLNEKSADKNNNVSESSQQNAVQKFKISICTDKESWINSSVCLMVLDLLLQGHSVSWVHDANDISSGDICFYLSYGSIVSDGILKKNNNNLVVHESALPAGKGWSPLTWQVIEGKSEIPVTLFEAADKVDSGEVYLQAIISLDGFELVSDLRKKQAETTIELCLEFLSNYPGIVEQGRSQIGNESFYPRRHPKDSELDVNKTLIENFNLLRVVDNQKYPAWFKINGKKYKLSIQSFEGN